MVVYLSITEDMIECFHSCVKVGNYLPLFKDYEQFFAILIENLQKIDFTEKSNCRGISENSFGILRYIKEFDPRQPSDYGGENEIPKFFQHLKQALISKGIIDLRIVSKGVLYESFKSRDKALDRLIQGSKIETPQSCPSSIRSGPSQPLPKTVSSKMYGVQQSAPTEIASVDGNSLTRAAEVKQSFPVDEAEKVPVQLVISEEMTKCFYSCCQKCNYLPLFKDYEPFFGSLAENFKKVHFLDNTYSREISENLTDIFRYVMGFNQNTNSDYGFETKIPEFFQALRQALYLKFWDNFYEKFQYVADIMIKSARIQGIMDLKIAWGSIMFETLEDRDVAMFSRGSKNRANHQKLEEKLSKNVEKEPSQPIRENVPSKTYEVRHAVPIEVSKINEASLTRVPEVRPTVPTSEEQLELIQIETDKKLNNLGNLNLEEKLETMETNQKHFDQQLNHINFSSNEMFSQLREQFSTKSLEIDEKIGKAMNGIENSIKERLENMDDNVKQKFGTIIATMESDLVNKMEERLAEIVVGIGAVRGNEHSESSNKPLEDRLKYMEEQWEKKMEEMNLMRSKGEDATQVLGSIDKKFNEQEQKLKLREEKLERKMEELKFKEDSVNAKIEGMKIREDSLDKKMEAMIEKSVKEQKQQFELSKVLLDRKMEAAIEKSFENQEEKIQLQEEMLEKKIETMIGRSVKEQEEKWKLKEELLNGKLKAMQIIEDSLDKKMEAVIEKKVQEQSKLREDFLNKKIEEMRGRDESLNEKIKEIIEQNVQEQKDQLKLKGDLLNKKMEEIKIEEESLNKKVEAIIEERVQEHEEKLKLKEDVLSKKLKEMKILEDSLSKKMEEMIARSVHEQKELLKLKEEMLDRKIENVKAKEELLDRKIDAMLELMKVFEQQNQPNVVDVNCSESSEGCSRGPGIKSTDRFQAIEEKTAPHPGHCQPTSVPM
ncbi:unnamed protein product [Caenorhabditis brenneri]